MGGISVAERHELRSERRRSRRKLVPQRMTGPQSCSQQELRLPDEMHALVTTAQLSSSPTISKSPSLFNGFPASVNGFPAELYSPVTC